MLYFLIKNHSMLAAGLLPASDNCQNYHSRLQTMLKAKANLKAIREARQTDGKEEAVVEKQNDPELPGEAKSSMV